MVMEMAMNERTTPTTKWVNKDVSFTRNSLSFYLSNLNAPRCKLHTQAQAQAQAHTQTHIGQIDRSPSTIENVTFFQTRYAHDCDDDDDDVFFYSDDVIEFFFLFVNSCSHHSELSI